ncbi:hypothetical protein Tco_0068254 [Tanacetum coccineum]
MRKISSVNRKRSTKRNDGSLDGLTGLKVLDALVVLTGTDNAKIIRKRSKLDKHRHGNEMSAQEAGVFY